MDKYDTRKITEKSDAFPLMKIQEIVYAIEKSEINIYAPLLHSINIKLNNILIENHLQTQLLARILLQNNDPLTGDLETQIFCEEILQENYHNKEPTLENICTMEP